MSKSAIILAIIAGGLFMVASRKTWAIPQKGMAWFPYFSQAEYQYGLPARLLARVAQQESNYNPTASNPSGARGMMQIIPRWHVEPGLNVTDDNPVDDIFYAAKYLRENYDRFGSWSKALAAYNWGPTALARAIDTHGANWLSAAPRETQDYVTNVTRDVGIV